MVGERARDGALPYAMHDGEGPSALAVLGQVNRRSQKGYGSPFPSYPQGTSKSGGGSINLEGGAA